MTRCAGEGIRRSCRVRIRQGGPIFGMAVEGLRVAGHSLAESDSKAVFPHPQEPEELYRERGGEHGRDWEDWFPAEQELGRR
jgi:hypothetical protein